MEIYTSTQDMLNEIHKLSTKYQSICEQRDNLKWKLEKAEAKLRNVKEAIDYLDSQTNLSKQQSVTLVWCVVELKKALDKE